MQVAVQSFIKNLGDLESDPTITRTSIQTDINLNQILIQENIKF